MDTAFVITQWRSLCLTRTPALDNLGLVIRGGIVFIGYHVDLEVVSNCQISSRNNHLSLIPLALRITAAHSLLSAMIS